jgi:cytochrome b subunit of formate dehydrogenase
MILIMLAGLATYARADDPIKNSECMDCHGDRTLTTTNSAGREISLFTDLAKLAASVHGTNSCISCHSDLTRKHPDDNLTAKLVNCTPCHEKQSQTYAASVHGVALRKGSLIAADCTDCHGSHAILPPNAPASPLSFTRLAETCGTCHEQEARDVQDSVHGQAVAAGRRDAPTCTDCHSEHTIRGLKNTSSLEISREICSKCHASERMNTKYNLPQDRVKTFFASYHGLAAQYGSTLAANCASCHGVHKILPSSDPRSTINPAHLVETCGKCHPGATENFALGKVHVAAADAGIIAASGTGERVNWWVRRIYLVLILGVIGGMLLHNSLLFARKMAVVYRSRRRPVLRMNFSQRAQHALLALSFIALAVTGFALKYPDSWIAGMLGSSEPFRRASHRVAAVILLLTGAYHLLYVLFTREGRQLARDFYPRFQDLKDVLRNLRYLAGLSRDKARFARFGYAEKMEYWAVVWGTLIMGVTGLMIWFKIDVTRYLPRWVVDVALNIHYYEAILACLAIVVWHFYHVIFDPDVYPLNPACWDGRVTEQWQQEEHPLQPTALADGASAEPPVKPVETVVADAQPPGKNK